MVLYRFFFFSPHVYVWIDGGGEQKRATVLLSQDPVRVWVTDCSLNRQLEEQPAVTSAVVISTSSTVTRDKSRGTRVEQEKVGE